jgi:hypothetical protein
MKKMKKIKFYFKTVFIAIATLLVGCEEENYEFGDLNSPTNLVVTADIVGASADNPNGDGSGVVNFSATADDVITYKYIYDGSEKMAPAGTQTYSFGDTGLHTYTVSVIAIGVAGVQSSTSVEVEVLATYNPPADLIQMLTGGSSRTWRLKAEAAGHFGVGPADADAPLWWSADPFSKDGLGAYDDRMTFNIDGSFSYVTNGDLFGKADPMAEDLAGDQGLEPNADAEYENYPYGDFAESWSLSAPGGNETLTFSDIGHHGFYVGGDHSYVILARSENEMSIRTVGKDGNGWFGILIAED